MSRQYFERSIMPMTLRRALRARFTAVLDIGKDSCSFPQDSDQVKDWTQVTLQKVQ